MFGGAGEGTTGRGSARLQPASTKTDVPCWTPSISLCLRRARGH
ncbi:hypothetical protein DA2_1554 [Desulfovibrio sp. A2]|nr:hypothetical protein DA2_1554 [Desulfovibrio sp. A2]